MAVNLQGEIVLMKIHCCAFLIFFFLVLSPNLKRVNNQTGMSRHR